MLSIDYHQCFRFRSSYNVHLPLPSLFIGFHWARMLNEKSFASCDACNRYYVRFSVFPKKFYFYCSNHFQSIFHFQIFCIHWLNGFINPNYRQLTLGSLISMVYLMGHIHTHTHSSRHAFIEQFVYAYQRIFFLLRSLSNFIHTRFLFCLDINT